MNDDDWSALTGLPPLTRAHLDKPTYQRTRRTPQGETWAVSMQGVPFIAWLPAADTRSVGRLSGWVRYMARECGIAGGLPVITHRHLRAIRRCLYEMEERADV